MILRECVPDSVLACLERLESSGFEAWLVGGAVRDLLMGQTSGDWDIATAALPDETEVVFYTDRVISVGRAHGTLRVILPDIAVDITTYRVDENYQDHRHPGMVHYVTSIADDLARRDFTINAMAWHPERGLYDPFGGALDLASQLIRAVGDASARLLEDALRIMRALRFAAVLGFLLDEELREAIAGYGHLLKKLPAERLGLEWSQLLYGCYAAPVVSQHLGVLCHALPSGPAARPFQAWRALAKLPAGSVLRHVAFAAAMDLNRTWFHTLLLTPDERRRAEAVMTLAADPDLPDVSGDTRGWRWLAAKYGTAPLSDYILVQRALTDGESPWLALQEAVNNWTKCGFLTLKDLAVDGHRLLALGIRPRDVGGMLKQLFLSVAEGKTANTADALLETAELWYNR